MVTWASVALEREGYRHARRPLQGLADPCLQRFWGLATSTLHLKKIGAPMPHALMRVRWLCIAPQHEAAITRNV